MNEETIKNNKGLQWLQIPFVTGVAVLRLSHFVRPHPVAVERDGCLLRLAFSWCCAYLHSKVGGYVDMLHRECDVSWSWSERSKCTQ